MGVIGIDIVCIGGGGGRLVPGVVGGWNCVWMFLMDLGCSGTLAVVSYSY
jgi:hypothetical protein